MPFKNFTDRGGNELRLGDGKMDELHPIESPRMKTCVLRRVIFVP